MPQRKFVLLELEAPDAGTPQGGGATTAKMEHWVWQDFFDKVANAEIKVLRVAVYDKGEVTLGFPSYSAYADWVRENEKRPAT